MFERRKTDKTITPCIDLFKEDELREGVIDSMYAQAWIIEDNSDFFKDVTQMRPYVCY